MVDMYKLFIVEDEEIIRNGLVNHIRWEEWGFQLCGHAPNGGKALDQIRGQEVDVVLTDVRMPVMDGLALAKTIKEEVDSSIRIVVLSGFGEFKYAQKSLEYGVFHYILKPIKIDQLAAVFTKLKLEMDEERKERAEVADLKLKAIESRRIYVDKLFGALIKGHFARIEPLQEAFVDALIQLKGIYFGCAVFDIDNRRLLGDEEQSRLESLLDHSLSDWMDRLEMEEDSSVAYYFLMDDKRRIVLIWNSSSSDLDKWQLVSRKARSLLEIALTEQTGIGAMTISVGVGSIAEDARHIQDSYRRACEALAYRMYIGASAVILEHELPLIRALEPSELQLIREKEERLIGRLSAGGEEPEAIVEDIIDVFRQAPSIDSVLVKKTIEQLLRNVSRQIAESNPKWKDQWNDDGSIDQLTDLEGLLAYTKGWIHTIGGQLRDFSRLEGRNLVKKVKEYVADKYHRPITLNEISERYFLNASYFSWMFKQEAGITFSAYLTALRMEAAKEMLKEDTHKVYEIAERVGYQDYRNFCKAFKKHVGVSPKDYKQHGRI